MNIWAECAGVDSILARQEVFIIRSDSDQSQIEDFGLTLEEGKGVSRQAQAEHTQIQVEQSGIINRSISRLETLRRSNQIPMPWLSTSPANRVLPLMPASFLVGKVNHASAVWEPPSDSGYSGPALTSVPLTLGTFGFRRERCIVGRGNMKYVRRSDGQASVDPNAVYKRQCEYIDTGEQGPPIRSRGPNCLLCSPETWTSEHEE